MQKDGMRNPFGATTVLSLVRTAQTDKVEKAGKEKEKPADLVGIYLAAIPALQKAKIELDKVRENLGTELQEKCSKWVEAIRAVEVEILQETIGVVSEQKAAEDAAAAPAGGITAGMISGAEPLPSAPAAQKAV